MALHWWSFLTDTSGDWILSSSTTYTRFISCLFFLGISGIVKDTFLTLHFGRRNVKAYQPQLEEIVDRIIVVSEIAVLSDWAAECNGSTNRPTTTDADRQSRQENEHEDARANRENSISTLPEQAQQRQQRQESSPRQISSESIRNNYVKTAATNHPIEWQSVQFDREKLARDQSDGAGYTSAARPLQTRQSATSAASDINSSTAATAQSDFTVSGTRRASRAEDDVPLRQKLYRWTPPVNKADDNVISLSDIYKFRKAIEFMDRNIQDAQRDDCIDKAEEVYNNLLKLCGNSNILDYNVLAVLNQSEGGFLDELQERAMKDLFRPDRFNQLSLVAFVQGCDSLFQTITFFRASVGNASILDSYLEGVINCLYGIVVGIVVISLLGFNPWPLLMSLSTIMVTTAFAVGPTVSKTIEGIMLIVVMRPYDIGDRIILGGSGKEIVDPVEASKSWFVEDISLFTTTLRYAPTNEVAMVSNGSICGSRIVNCARSKKAKINLTLKFHARFHDSDNAVRYFQQLQSFVADNRQCWKDIHLFACTYMDTASEQIHYSLRVQSRRNWQSATAIMEERAELIAFCNRLARKMCVHYVNPKQRRIVYGGGSLKDGGLCHGGDAILQGYEADLLDPQNVFNSSNAAFPVVAAK